MPQTIVLPCDGTYTDHKIPKNADIVAFVTDPKKCKLTGLTFTTHAGAFKKKSGAGFVYDYDASDISDGAQFTYSTDLVRGGGNGTGVVHN